MATVTIDVIEIIGYIKVDAGRTQIPSGSKTVIGIGPAPESHFIGVTDNLKLL